MTSFPLKKLSELNFCLVKLVQLKCLKARKGSTNHVMVDSLMGFCLLTIRPFFKVRRCPSEKGLKR